MSERERPSTSRRITAIAAIVALAGAVAIVTTRAAKNWQGLLLAPVGLLVIGIAGWYLVSRRGPWRTLSLLIALAGLALLITGLIVADFNINTMAAAIVLTALSVGCARYALGKGKIAHREAIAARKAMPKAERPVLIMNPKSGGGKAEKYDLVGECRRRGIEAVVLRPGDDLLELAEDAIAEGADVIGMAGGDGSQALVATVAIKHAIPHVVIPAGTRNHFALDLGLDRDDVVGALDAYSDGFEVSVDLAQVNGRVFVNNATLGLYAKIVQSPQYRDAKGKTAAEMLPEMLGPEAVPLDLRFTGPDGTKYPTAQVILVSNDPYELDRIEGRGTRARMDLGTLGVVAAQIASTAEAERFIALEAAGQIKRFAGWLEWAAPRFQIDSGGPVEIGIDGEAMKLDPPLVFETMPGALRVRLPRHALGVSPAGQALHLLSRSTYGELVNVAFGKAPQG
jgi:diacylglycerol kinase family enzyme